MYKLSIATSYTDPEKRMDPWKESLKCYEDFADEVVVVGQNWKYEFSFDQIGTKQFQIVDFEHSDSQRFHCFDAKRMFSIFSWNIFFVSSF